MIVQTAMEQQRLAYLLDRHADNLITDEEAAELMAYLHAHSGDAMAGEAGEAFLAANENLPADPAPYRDIAHNILSLDRRAASRPRGLLAVLGRYKVAAAAILLVLAASAFLLLRKPAAGPQLAHVTPAIDVQPGREGAILTRADGSTVLLDSLPSGEIDGDNGANLKLGKGRISYTGATATGNEIFYNTIATPNGRTYHLLLQDGSKIWLNAGSSVTYPVVFTGKERKVRIRGEAYFEVAKAAGKPFFVDVDGRAEVEVLGTHFNVNAYNEDGMIRTALLEGAVRVRSGSNRPGTVLEPGQQVTVSNQGGMTVTEADFDEVNAWRNGLFHFRKASLQEVMREVARWYDVEVRFEGKMPERTFSGDIERTLSLQQVLALLRVTRINYTIDNQKQITIRY
ncbi:FecR family protein [Chitinophaga sp. XS-30]|uniref:FecR family protein n=1 Tax=Chitinophaga sp. XS-30 TaxID=2604421 RepID=UPI0011DD2B59|nr:FecR family protein [Chitinophaga sp. XS-30]QEH39398.1 DUF4974 domain-containing protein [Chitinophaga sp. XS-30]